MADLKLMAALLRRDASFFNRFAFHVTGGEDAYQHNWHIDAMLYQLERVAIGEIKRLLLTMPPRHLKSHTASIAYPARQLGLNPALRFITVSYGSDLAEKQARDMLKIMDHSAYKLAFPGLQLTRRRADDIETNLGGGRLSTSLGGTLTGRGADTIIIDDPTKSAEASSQAVRESDRNWLCNTLMTRLNDPETGAIIDVMQRLHEEDLVGVLKEQGGWHELKLPAIAPEDALIAIGQDRLYQRRKGHALHPQRMSLARLEEQRRAMGSANFAAQYQQEPVPAEGNLIKAEWLRSFDPATFALKPGQIVQSWDTAVSEGENCDYSVCVTAHVLRGDIYILDVYRRRMEFPKLRYEAIRLARKYNANVLLIEGASSGNQLVQDLRSNRPSGVPRPLKRKVDVDKISRVAGSSAMIEAGQLFLPREASWLADFTSEILGFPNSRHDDQVDALSQLLIWVRDQNRNASGHGIGAPIFR